MLNVSDALTVRIKLKLSQLIDVVRPAPASAPAPAPLPLPLRHHLASRIRFVGSVLSVLTDQCLCFLTEFEESDHDDQFMGGTGKKQLARQRVCVRVRGVL